jgi:hypothetical protein
MYIGIRLENSKGHSRQAFPRERRTQAKGTAALSKRRLFLAALTILVAALLVVQVAEVGSSADISPGPAQATEASTGEDTPPGDPFPSLQEAVYRSPYAHEPISISGGAGGINLPK